MDTLSSSEFRKRYATLTDRTRVTVNGHPIGDWIPTLTPDELSGRVPANVVIGRRTQPFLKPAVEKVLHEFRPVPKPSQKGK